MGGNLSASSIDYKVNDSASRLCWVRLMTDLQEQAKQHLMLHFSDMTLAPEDIPVLVRGDGCHIYDDLGNRYIDGLSGLYCTNLGHSHGEEIGAAAAAQMATLPFTTNWTTAHPPAIELATKLAELAPPGFERTLLHLRRLGVGRVGLQARPPVAPGQRRARAPQGDRPPRRLPRHLARSALLHRHPGLPDRRSSRSPSRRATSPPRTPTAIPQGDDEAAFTKALLEEIEEVIDFERPETIAMIIMEPVQNAGGSITPPEGYWDGLREICDRHGILLVSDEVICAFGRIGEWFGAQRLGSAAGHDHLRQGPDRRPLLDGRPAHARPDRRALPDRQGRLPARDHVRRPPGRLEHRPEGDRDHGAREGARQRPRQRAASPASCSRASRTSRSSATSAAWATSSRSRSSRTRRPARRSPRTRRAGCSRTCSATASGRRG